MSGPTALCCAICEWAFIPGDRVQTVQVDYGRGWERVHIDCRMRLEVLGRKINDTVDDEGWSQPGYSSRSR